MNLQEVKRWFEGQLPAMELALSQLVNVNSHTGNVAGGRAVGGLLEQLFAMPGLEHELVPSKTFADHHVFRSSGNSGQPVALLGHLDTVFPPGVFEGYRIDGTRRRGPGVLDMKGGLVVVAWALKAVAATAGLSAVVPLRVVVVSDEEVGSPEGAALIRKVIAGSRACLVFESGRANDAIVTQRRGTGNMTCRAYGKAAHAGNNYWQGANAIWALARFVDAVQQLSDEKTEVTVNVGTFAGGTAKNTVPAEATAELDLRFSTAEGEAKLIEGIERAAAKSAIAGTRLELENRGGRKPMERTSASAALAAAYGRCARLAGLSDGEAPRQGGGSDGNTAAALGIATIDALGPRGEGFHTGDEYIDVETLVPRSVALASFLLEIQR